MKKRPKCEIEGCINDALLIFCGMSVCGNCYMKYYRELQRRQFIEMKKILRRKNE